MTTHTTQLAATSGRPTVARSRVRKDVLPTRDKLACWALTTGLTIGVASEWLNQSWILHICQLTVLLATVRIVGLWLRSRPALRFPASVYVICLASVLGIVQLVTGQTVYLQATLLSSLSWTTFACLVCLGSVLLRNRQRRMFFLGTLLVFASSITLMELYQLFVLGRYNVLAAGLPLLSSNYYAELAELLIPVAIYLAQRQVPNQWLGNCVAAVMAATVVASGARAGSGIVFVELIVCFAVGWREAPSQKLKRFSPILVTVGLTAVLILIEGAGALESRLLESRPLQHRQDFLAAAVEMVKQRPVAGFGLGSFPIVYPQFQRYDSSYLINHVHDDYMEMTTEGGAVLLLTWLTFIGLSLRAGVKDLWRLGCLGLSIHSFTDFPLYRPYAAALLAILLAEIPKRLVDPSNSLGREELSQPKLKWAETRP